MITTGGRYDLNMLATVAELNVPIVMMHMRGTPQTMTSKDHVNYLSGDCVAEVAVGTV
jgi:dihydropteroate synthase